MKTFPISGLKTVFVVVAAVALINITLANDFHPDIPLLDQQGDPVIHSGAPLSTITTCGACHDTDFIQAHSDHADAGVAEIGTTETLHNWDTGRGYFGAWNPIDYALTLQANQQIDLNKWLQQYGSRHVGGGPVADLVEMDCLLCHSALTDNQARNQALAEKDFAWATSAPLQAIDALEQKDGEWIWNPQAFKLDGSLADGLLSVNKPSDENCAQCHGQVSNDIESPLMLDSSLQNVGMTLRTGQIISPQKINVSGLNIKNKNTLSRAFDVHSDRILGCVNCHYSLNNPVYFQRNDKNQPKHLVFDPRRLTNADYLNRPLHQFAKGDSNHGLAATESANSLRRCESCHAAENVHAWLPYKNKHFGALACESCHIPELYGPTLKAVDWSMLDANAEPLRQYRNSSDQPFSSANLLSAFEPILLPRKNVGGNKKLAPFNLISSWYWIAGEPAKPVSKALLKTALFKTKSATDNIYRDSLLLKLDSNQDNQLLGDELRLDSTERSAVVKAALEAIGLVNVSLQSEVSAFAISHSVVNGKWATRDCQSCHHKESKVDAIFALSEYKPGGLSPVLQDNGVQFSGSLLTTDSGALEFHADASKAGFYVIGKHGVSLVDIIGLLMFFGIVLGVSAHAIARYFAARKRGPGEHHYERTYIYDAYERLWHWLQASSIIILILTGLIIHKPHIFGIFSFPYMVGVHNVVGFILLINAALALFYNLASGEIRQYLPEPKGFIGRTIAQASYYSKGIFEGKPHPVEKSAEHKMNPLQQVTYLIILNVLLPAQVITGVLIWGAQRWPILAQIFGGLPVLAPVHTLIAWAFATFIVMHVYLTTTGHTPSGGIKSMVEGWDHVEKSDNKDS